MLVGVDYRMGESVGLKQIEEAHVECRLLDRCSNSRDGSILWLCGRLSRKWTDFFSALALAAGFMRLF